MMDYRCSWLSLLVALLLVIDGPPSALRTWQGGVAALNVTVLHSGDGYGSVVPMDSSNSPCRPLAAAPFYEPSKSPGPCYGGLARRSGVVEAVRTEVGTSGGSVVLIDAGSALLGSLFYLTYGPEVIATYYNMMDYDAVKLEVHDFTPGLGPVGDFTRLLAHGGNATVVASNVVNLNNDSRFESRADGAQVVPYALITLAGGGGGAGEVLGFVGTMAQGLASMFGNPREVNSTRELVAMRNTVAMLQNMGVNKIVASVSGASVVDDIVNEVPGIDVLIVLSQFYCGNNSDLNCAGPYPTVRVMPWRQPVLIVGTGVNNGKYLGRLDLEFDDYGVITSWQGEPVLLDDSSPVDTVMQADIVQRQAKVDDSAGQRVGCSLIELAYEHNCMFGECTIGAWSVDAIRAQGKTQIAMANGGTMYGRIRAGNITLGELQTALPLHAGMLYTYSLKGRYLWQALENSVKLVTDTDLNLSQGIGRFLQVSGLRVLYNPQEKVGWRIVDVMVETSRGVWERLRDDQDYTVTSFRWLAVMGGDDYKMISNNAQKVTDTRMSGSYAYLMALASGAIAHVDMGRLNTSSLSTRSCHTESGSLCNGNGVCVLGRCQCFDPSSASLLCESGVSESSSLSTGGIAGIVVGCAVAAVCVLVTVVFITALLTSFRKRPARQEWLIDFDELEIGDLLGRGGYGEVYRGKWKGTSVAVKTISAENITRDMKKNFIEETSIMSRLRHPNIVLFMAASSKPPLLCIVMEYMALGSLYDLLHNDLVNDIPFALRLKLMYQAAKGMHFLHSSGIAHRDLKSLNLLLDHKWNVKVADFGLTVLRDSAKRKGDGDGVVGSVPWMAPEMLQREPHDLMDFVLADVYSFGIILWEMLTRSRPYEGFSPAQVAVAVIRDDIRPTLPSALELADHERQYLNLMSACWHRDPSVRPVFHSVMETLVKIGNAVGGNSSSGNVFSSSSDSSGGAGSGRGDSNGGRPRPADSMSLVSSRSLSSSRGSDHYDYDLGPKSKSLGERVPRVDVTFVVCDLARFDQVWQRNPAAADKAIRRFSGLVRHNAAVSEGHIYSRPSIHSGGTFFVAFARQSVASSFALALQSDIAREASTKEGQLRRHARVGITYRAGPCSPPAEDRTRSTYHQRDYAEVLSLVSHCPPGAVVCSRDFRISFEAQTAPLDDDEDSRHQELHFTERRDGMVQLSRGTVGAEQGEDDDDCCDNGEVEETESKGVCSSDRCPWIIDAESIELGECIGEGSFAEVLEGMCDGRPVAVKRLFNSRLDDNGMRKMRKEAAILSGVDHPNVVKLIGLSVTDRSLLMVMELVPGGTLRSLLSNPSTTLKWLHRLAMLRDAAIGIAFLHSKGIVHRDLKSSNLLVDGQLRVKVADFGFATVKQDNCTMTRCGSPSWTAPEVLAPVFTTTAAESGGGSGVPADKHGARDAEYDENGIHLIDSAVYSEKADVYSFGIVMWEVLTRRVPYEEGNLTTVAIDVLQGKRPPVPSDSPPQYAKIMRRCWHQKPGKRPGMDDVLIFLNEQLADLAESV